jgi:hypothetical protein
MSDPARCLDCGYVLTGLDTYRCPECGREFYLSDPTSYTTKPLFVPWKYWLPGLLLALTLGPLLFVVVLLLAGWGIAATFVAPACIGMVVGYGCTINRMLWFRVWLTMTFGIVLVSVLALHAMAFVGVFCGSVLAAVMLLPVAVGVAAGYVLRERLKDSHFDQRKHLPILLMLTATVLCAWIERLVASPHAIETIVTSTEIPAPVGQAWNALMFYEEVRHRPPWLLRYGLPRPLYTCGSTQHVGDTKVCVYTKGHLTKRVTRREPDKLLAFDVIEQDRIENNSVRLTGGSFRFIPDFPDHTRVELSTSYQPKLGPRWVWRPFEKLAVHTLHRHVLEGMRIKAEDHREGAER